MLFDACLFFISHWVYTWIILTLPNRIAFCRPFRLTYRCSPFLSCSFMSMSSLRGVVTKKLADGTVQLRLGDKRCCMKKIRCRTLDDHWRVQAAAAAAPETPDCIGKAPMDSPPVLVLWRAKVLTHIREAIRRLEDNVAEWGYEEEDFPVLFELQEMQLRLRTDPFVPNHEAHAVLRKAKITLYMSELSSDSD